MVRQPTACDTYKYNDIELRVYRFENPLEVRYQVKAGISYIELGELEYDQLLDILAEYESDSGNKSSFWKRLRKRI